MHELHNGVMFVGCLAAAIPWKTAGSAALVIAGVFFGARRVNKNK
jgi:hypothetical protein